MSKIILNVKNVLQKFDRVAYEDKVIGSLCKRGFRDYVLLVTNKRLVLAHISRENKITFENIYYDTIKKIEINIFKKNNYIEVISDSKKHTLYFVRKEELLVIRSELTLYLEKKITTFDSTIDKKLEEKNTVSPLFYVNLIKSFFFNFFKVVFSKFFIIPFLLICFFYFVLFLKNQKLAEADLCNQQIEIIYQEIQHYAQKNKKEPDNFYDFIRSTIKIKGVKDTAKDPWDNLFTMREKAFIREQNIRKKVLISYGPDRKPDTNDDVVKEFDIIEISQDNTKVKK